ncbi:MAG: RNA polymerase sigma factor [Thermoanaerobaculia bacterium]
MSRKPRAGSSSPAATAQQDRELALLARVARRDREAFEQLYRLLHPRLTRYLWRYLRDAGQVEDTIQEVFLAVWRQASAFRGDSQVSTWVIGIAYRKALDLLRRHSGRPIPVPAGEDDRGEAAEGRGGAGSSGAIEARVALREALAALPEPQRTVVELTYFRGLSYREIAAQVGCPENTVKTRMFHARRKLRQALEWSSLEGGDDA